MTDIVATRGHLQAALDELETTMRTLANEWTGTIDQKIKLARTIETTRAELAKALRELK